MDRDRSIAMAALVGAAGTPQSRLLATMSHERRTRSTTSSDPPRREADGSRRAFQALIDDTRDWSEIEFHLPRAETLFDLDQVPRDRSRLVPQVDARCMTLRLADADWRRPSSSRPPEVIWWSALIDAKGLEIRIADTGCGRTCPVVPSV